MAAKKGKQLLIDADILLYRFAHTNEYDIVWEEGVVSKVISGDRATQDVARFIEDMCENAECTSIPPILIFSGQNNFRYHVLPTYKWNRKGLVKPQLYAPLKEWMKEQWAWREIYTLEGDDTLGIMHTRHPGKYVVASIDKDMMQIPGMLYNWDRHEMHVITEAQADRVFYMQCITGDYTDGYKGVPGLGKVRAAKILDVSDEHGFLPWTAVVSAYFTKNLTEDDALVQAQVARILRCEDWNFETNKVRLWTPVRPAMR